MGRRTKIGIAPGGGGGTQAIKDTADTQDWDATEQDTAPSFELQPRPTSLDSLSPQQSTADGAGDTTFEVKG